MRCRRSSPTSTPPRTSAAWRSAASSRARSTTRARRSPGAGATGASNGSSVAELLVPSGLERVRRRRGGPGELDRRRGHRRGHGRRDARRSPTSRSPLPLLVVDEPSLSMTVGINTSPLAGRDGTKLTARQLRGRVSKPRCSATSPSVSSRPAARTPSRYRAEASSPSRSSSRRCAGRASS